MRPNDTPKVGYLLKTFPKLSETFILNEIRQLERMGTSLHLFSLKRPALGEKIHPAVSELQAKVTYIRPVPRFTRLAQFLKCGVDCDPLETRYLSAHLQLLIRNPVRYVSTFWFYIHAQKRRPLKQFIQAGALARALQRRNIRHLHAHFANVPASVAEFVRCFSGITFSFTAHAKDIYLSNKRELARKMRCAEFVLTCTGYNKRYLESIGAGSTPIYLAYHGVDLSRFRSLEATARREGPPRILSVGRFCEKKGFEYLIRACAILKQRGCEFSCAIVGWGPTREKLERLIAELDAASHVSLVPEMTQDELVLKYEAADLFVLSCIMTDDGDRDGIPNVLIEAMAMRVPVISTDVSGIPELVQHMQTGLLLPEKDEGALAEAMALLLDHPELRSRLGENGRAKVLREFALENNVGVIQELLEAAAGTSTQVRQQGLQATAGAAR